MAIHLFNDAVPRKWRLINLVLFLISLLLASPICRVTKGRKGERRERKNRLHIYAAHSSLRLSLPLTFSASFLTFGKCQRKNCAQNEAQFTALVVCKLSHLQCAPRSFPIPLPSLVITSPSHPISIMIACSRFLLFHVASDIFKLHPQIYIVCLPFPPFTFLPSPPRPSSKH